MKKEHTAELASLISNRGATYGLLSRLYETEIDEALLNRMKQARFEIDKDSQIEDIVQGYRLWDSFLGRSGEDTLATLAVDYVRAFIGAGKDGRSAAYPYESVYTSPDRLLMQEARDAVLEFYWAEGLNTVERFNEPEDHIAVELELMAHLCAKSAEALQAGDISGCLDGLKRQKTFLDRHLLPWVPGFCQDVLKFARQDLYRGLALVTRGFLLLERDVVNDLIAELSGIETIAGE